MLYAVRHARAGKKSKSHADETKVTSTFETTRQRQHYYMQSSQQHKQTKELLGVMCAFVLVLFLPMAVAETATDTEFAHQHVASMMAAATYWCMLM